MPLTKSRIQHTVTGTLLANRTLDDTMFPYPLSAERVLRRFNTALEQDDFHFNRTPSEVHFGAVHAFLRMFQAVPRTMKGHIYDFPNVSDLTGTLAELLKRSATLDGTTIAIADMICFEFCVEPFNAMLHDISEDDIKREMQECGVRSTSAWLQLMRSEAVAPVLIELLFNQMVTQLGNRTLLSFFVKPAPENTFRSIGSWNYSGLGTALKTRQLELSGSTVTIDVSRYHQDEMATDLVRAYEWNARLRQHGQAEDVAGACGMVYVFRRVGGWPIGDSSELLAAADTIADRDVLQAHAFLQQHEDAEEIIEGSDLCFVWLWERRTDGPKGSGADCLQAAISDLRRRFKSIRNVIIDTKPMQFVDWAKRDFPVVQVEKQEAIERLVEYVATIPMRGVSVRHIFNKQDNDSFAALLALGDASF